jgi:hypothetical protein
MAPEPTDYLIECPKCNSKTYAGAISRTTEKAVDDPWQDYWYTVVECTVCHEVMLVEALRRISPDMPELAKVVWPQLNQELSDKIPKTLRLEVGEARACFRSSAYTATVVMVRRTLEGICAEHGLKSSPLFKALTQMKESGLIDGRLLEWAQALRTLGNEGAHFTGNRVSRQDAEDALALAAAILNYVYLFSEQFAEFSKRRQPPKSGISGTIAKS